MVIATPNHLKQVLKLRVLLTYKLFLTTIYLYELWLSGRTGRICDEHCQDKRTGSKLTNWECLDQTIDARSARLLACRGGSRGIFCTELQRHYTTYTNSDQH